MVKRLRQGVAPLYLFLCLLMGGSAQGPFANLFLQLVGLAIIVWASIAPAEEPQVKPARQLLWLAVFALALVLLQLIPLPAGVWADLGGRKELADGYALLGLATPAMPLSLTPYRSLDSLLGIIPPLAMVVAIVRLKASRGSWLAAALIAGTIAGVLLGALQVGTVDADSAPWYLYPQTNIGSAVGFFANANHMAILLVVTLPFLAALVAAAKRSEIQHLSALIALVVGAGLVILVGVLLNRSLAAYALVLPVVVASALIIIPMRSRVRPVLMIVALLLLAGGVGLIANNSTNSGSLGVSTSVQSRDAMFRTTVRAMGDFMPFGSGLGSFPKVYDLYEDARTVTNTYVVHAHNDYAELALELGLPGIVLILLGLGWWGASSWRVWRSAESAPFARAASIASGAILAHSLVDFPLRTAAISAVFAFCLALLADRRAPPPVDPTDIRPTRHVEYR
ncbi:MAG: O-antigen ligase family protein [Pseudomonadota bacterium]